MEGVKGNAYGEHNGEEAGSFFAAKHTHKVIKRIVQEVEILKKQKRAKASNQRCCHDQLLGCGVAFCLFQEDAAKIGHHRGEENEKDQPRIPIHIKIVRRGKQGQKAESMRCYPKEEKGNW